MKNLDKIIITIIIASSLFQSCRKPEEEITPYIYPYTYEPKYYANWETEGVKHHFAYSSFRDPFNPDSTYLIGWTGKGWGNKIDDIEIEGELIIKFRGLNGMDSLELKRELLYKSISMNHKDKISAEFIVTLYNNMSGGYYPGNLFFYKSYISVSHSSYSINITEVKPRPNSWRGYQEAYDISGYYDIVCYTTIEPDSISYPRDPGGDTITVTSPFYPGGDTLNIKGDFCLKFYNSMH